MLRLSMPGTQTDATISLSSLTQVEDEAMATWIQAFIRSIWLKTR